MTLTPIPSILQKLQYLESDFKLKLETHVATLMWSVERSRSSLNGFIQPRLRVVNSLYRLTKYFLYFKTFIKIYGSQLCFSTLAPIAVDNKQYQAV